MFINGQIRGLKVVAMSVESEAAVESVQCCGHVKERWNPNIEAQRDHRRRFLPKEYNE